MQYLNDIADIHIKTFPKFFLTFLGRGFIRQLYKGFITHSKSNVIGVIENDIITGFLAYSENISVFYKYLIKKSFIQFGWYSFLAFIKKPKIMFRLLRAFTYSKKSKKEEAYIELSSIGVLPEFKNKGIGTMLIDELKKIADTTEFKYIRLETDATENDAANAFYVKNNFVLTESYETPEGRKMNEYKYILL